MTTDGRVERVLRRNPVASLRDAERLGGGRLARTLDDLDPLALIDTVTAAGLRGRGGAGFPTARKWDTVRRAGIDADHSPAVVVNAAEGEPGSFKDRLLIRRDPYRVLEGACIAARAVGGNRVIVALKEGSTVEARRLADAAAEFGDAGWAPGIAIEVFTGPREYLLGEETALLEAVDGRPPFPRVTPPYRRGIDEETIDLRDPDRTAARAELAGPSDTTVAAPTLVDNVETLAHAACIALEGADWFRSLGTAESPGTVVATVSGQCAQHGVAEFPMGTPLVEVLATVGAVDRRDVAAVLPGVSGAWLRPDDLDCPLTYEDFAALGSSLGTAGFIVAGAGADLLALAAAVARFLAVESCGQCTPCKQDGRTIAATLAAMIEPGPDVREDEHRSTLLSALGTVGDSARCALAGQQQATVGTALERFPDLLAGPRPAVVDHRIAELIAPLADLDGTRFTRHLDELAKQPDWTYEDVDSGQAPADRLMHAGDRLA